MSRAQFFPKAVRGAFGSRVRVRGSAPAGRALRPAAKAQLAVGGGTESAVTTESMTRSFSKTTEKPL